MLTRQLLSASHQRVHECMSCPVSSSYRRYSRCSAGLLCQREISTLCSTPLGVASAETVTIHRPVTECEPMLVTVDHRFGTSRNHQNEPQRSQCASGLHPVEMVGTGACAGFQLQSAPPVFSRSRSNDQKRKKTRILESRIEHGEVRQEFLDDSGLSRTPERDTETNRGSRLVSRGHRPRLMPRSYVHSKLCDQFLLEASVSLGIFAAASRRARVPSYSHVVVGVLVL